MNTRLMDELSELTEKKLSDTALLVANSWEHSDLTPKERHCAILGAALNFTKMLAFIAMKVGMLDDEQTLTIFNANAVAAIRLYKEERHVSSRAN